MKGDGNQTVVPHREYKATVVPHENTRLGREYTATESVVYKATESVHGQGDQTVVLHEHQTVVPHAGCKGGGRGETWRE